ncbi:MAG: type II toxin-antitoxin system HipA family toxin [Lachnospiraceae bacterium]|nr:type II toxin-antitoxin system HipA family toxin [Lachnospiraceae bacterium]
MNNDKMLNVWMENRKVGTLALTANHLAAFEYDSDWLSDGFSISPLSLPLRKGVFIPKNYDPFEGLFGVFSDSLPDGWGRLLVDRLLARAKINPAEVDSISRLAIVGTTGMGALTYQPERRMDAVWSDMSLDEIALECEKMFATEESDNLDVLFQMGGSSGGARPKIFYRIDGEEWIVKFPSSADRKNIGEQEYDYSVCAKKCGIEMPETRLLPSKRNTGYFAVRRFDRERNARIHMVSVSGLLETSHRIPNLDYHILMQLTMKLTQSYEEIEKLYRQTCFNVFAHNRDDHSKNFSFLYKDGKWRLSPAYDLTYSNSIGGEHATTVNGNGSNPDIEDLLAVAKRVKFDEKKARRIAGEVREIVGVDLKKYLRTFGN